MAEDPKPAPATDGPSWAAYVVGSVVLWALVLSPLADWITGEWKGFGASALRGAFLGLFWGLCMHPFERWLRRRAERKRAAGAGEGATPP